jgi:serine/threonine-protein kinase
VPTDTGKIVSSFLVRFFPVYVDYEFTARLEDDLDDISRGDTEWVPVLHAFWKPFIERVTDIEKTISREEVAQARQLGVDAASGAPFIVMERLEGETLHERLGRSGLLPFNELLPIFEQLCHAVAAAHAAGIVHRDLKPENVFLAQTRRASGPALSVKVLDFGIAKLVAEVGARGTTAAMGSPLWMAPEQTEPGSITPAADVWSLGLIAFYALTGNHFWRAARDSRATVSQLFRELVLDDIPPASVRADERASRALLPEGFDAWFGCVFAPLKGPQQRPPPSIIPEPYPCSSLGWHGSTRAK